MAQLIFRTNTHDQIWHKSIEDLLEKKMPDTTFDFNFLAAMMDKPNLVRSFDASWGGATGVVWWTWLNMDRFTHDILIRLIPWYDCRLEGLVL